MTKIYTKTGDAGQTGLIGGARVPKSDARVEAYGDVDELSSALGVARAQLDDAELDGVLAQAQRDLVVIGAELATPFGARGRAAAIDAAAVGRLEQAIDRWEAALPPLDRFILPAGSPGAAALHLARTVCRRAERHSTQVPGGAPPLALAYLNRLSDLLFVAARLANARAGVAEE
ncbi:MAG TPA: cob(I)yrinic acid a,c-diamide adenosyltransferase [Anaeromyxobacteraceae bacterium]|nr:cob(I)yrinic acid a,c-diamide adenosyltransferase [Anaeromyxobacteraceae bacterium]